MIGLNVWADGISEQRWLVSCKRQAMLTQGPAPDPRHELKNIFPHVSILFIVSEAQLILSKKLTTTQNSFHHFPYWLHKIV